jgi:hypothetical protein
VPRLAVDDLVHADARIRLRAVKEHQIERQAFGAPDGSIGAKANVAVLVVAEQLELGGLPVFAPKSSATNALTKNARSAPRALNVEIMLRACESIPVLTAT